MYKTKHGVTRRGLQYDFLLTNYERFTQTSALLAPTKVGAKSRAQAPIIGYVLNWYPYRQQCGNIGEWIFASHEMLAQKCGITSRQSQDAVAVLKRYERIETKQRMVKGVKKLHLRPTGAMLKLVNNLGEHWEYKKKTLQPVWDEALNMDLLTSDSPNDRTLHHLVRRWDEGKKGMSLLLPTVPDIFKAAEARVKNKTTVHGDLLKDKTTTHGDLLSSKPPYTGTSVSPSTGISINETDKETDNYETDTAVPTFKGSKYKAVKVDVSANKPKDLASWDDIFGDD